MRQTRRGAKGSLGDGNTGWEDQVRKCNYWLAQGGYMNAKIRKLEAQFTEENQKTSIFSGVRIYVNGYTGIVLLLNSYSIQNHQH